MTKTITWVLEMEVQAGQGENVRPLLDEMVAATQADEPGALTYEYYHSADQKHVTVIERYADDAAAMVHLGNFGAKFAERFLAAFTPVRFMVYGPAETDLQGALAGFGAQHMGHLVGFARDA